MTPSPELPSPGRAWIDELEVCVGIPFGRQADVASLTRNALSTPLEALSDVVLRAVARPPCVVTFSGGRDSSAVLALATHVARANGLPDPVPITNRFDGAPESEESQWQESVVAHLRLRDWEILTWSHEMDAIGPFAQRLLTSIGVGPPFNRHFILPMIDAASGGGSVLTGIGGDELFDMPLRSVAHRVLHRRAVARLRDLPGAAAQMLPHRVRARRMADEELGWAWVRPDARQELMRRYSDWMASVPLRWDVAVTDWWWRARMLQLMRRQFEQIGLMHDVRVTHPFAEPSVLSSAAATYGAAGPGGRTRALRALFASLLPDEVLTRSTKATFDDAFSNRWTAAFADAWTGDHIDTSLVIEDEVRAAWLDAKDARSLLLLQQTWLQSTQPAQ